jgi:hypothetical protein
MTAYRVRTIQASPGTLVISCDQRQEHLWGCTNLDSTQHLIEDLGHQLRCPAAQQLALQQLGFLAAAHDPQQITGMLIGACHEHAGCHLHPEQARHSRQSAGPVSQSAGTSVSRPAQSVSRPGQSVSRPAQSVSRPAQSVSRPAQSVSQPARVCLHVTHLALSLGPAAEHDEPVK